MINVLLSTCNGSNFLCEQIDSLLEQTITDAFIFIRDDSSTDKTIEILQRFATQYPCIEFQTGENIGIVKSFFTLLKNSSGADYYSFCDQDDIWYLDKIERAIKALAKIDSHTPALYFSRLEYVDENLKHIGYSNVPQYDVVFENALVENVATGCTMVMNKSARDLIISHLPANCAMHDWWCLLVISAFGEIIYDAKPSVKYRLHSGNAVGAPKSFVEDYCRRIVRLLTRYNQDNWVHAQARKFQLKFGAVLSKEKSAVLLRFIDSRKTLISRLRYALSPDVFRQRKMDSIIFRILMVLNRY